MQKNTLRLVKFSTPSSTSADKSSDFFRCRPWLRLLTPVPDLHWSSASNACQHNQRQLYWHLPSKTLSNNCKSCIVYV